jgi:hypothetical protein
MANKRFIWGQEDYYLLQNIILNSEGGRFKRIIADRDTGKNMEKLQAWTEVTRLFNEVVLRSC